jgi:hypothetical protein
MGKTGDFEPQTAVEQLTGFNAGDLHDLCDAAEAAVLDGGGFGWLKPPPRHVMETYWKGVLLVPERELHVARVDGTIAGSAQLQRPPKNNEAQALTGQLTTFFLAPWARGHGLAERLVESNPHYAWVEGRWVTGYFYYKDLVGNGATVPDEERSTRR